MAETDGKPLAGYRWQKRVLLVFADGRGSTESERQREALAAASDGVRDRDLVIVAAVGDVVEVDGALSVDLRPDQLRRAYDVPSGRFQVLLIGKDGGVKLRSTEPVPVDRLFGTIDAMPMRRREMQARGAPS